jgi:hypothetical protein
MVVQRLSSSIMDKICEQITSDTSIQLLTSIKFLLPTVDAPTIRITPVRTRNIATAVDVAT